MTQNNNETDNKCSKFDIENIFHKFRLVEFPKSYINLRSCLDLQVDVSLEKSAVLKTYCQGRLMKFEEAQHISVAHAAFSIDRVSEKLLRITFIPTKHCVTKASKDPAFDFIFICDLRLLKVDDVICCDNENHLEMGRFYVTGQVEFPQITYFPSVVDFGEVKMYEEAKKYVTVTNNSNNLTVRFQNVKRYGFKAKPLKCLIPPNSSRRIRLSVTPSTLKISNTMMFQIMNPIPTDKKDSESNYLPYGIKVSAQVHFNRGCKPKAIESVHAKDDIDYTYAYTEDELGKHLQKKEIANNFLAEAKARRKKTRYVDPYKLDYYYEDSEIEHTKNICEQVKPEFTLFDVINIILSPWSLDFGKIALSTYGQGAVTIKNRTEFKITILFCNSMFVRYTEDQLEKFKLKIPPDTEKTVEMFCLGSKVGIHDLTFDYVIQNKIFRKYPFRIRVETPKITVAETCLKFGMVTNDYFITSVPIRLINDFNVPVEFYWQKLDDEIPFEIIPMAGCLPKQSCRLCSVIFVRKSTKAKFYKVNLYSGSGTTEIISIELILIRKKISAKFLDAILVFKNIPLNLKIQEKVLLENLSREILNFFVVDPLLPGLEIEPMMGIIPPKSLITFEINLMFGCLLEFSCDITVRINCKENIYLTIEGKVVEPKITIIPKNLVIPRIPALLYTYIPITLNNAGTAKSVIEIINPRDGYIFDVFFDVRNEKIPCKEFTLEAGHSKVIFVKVFDNYRREYEMYIPIKVNGLLGAILKSPKPLELQYYTKDYEEIYATNNRVKLKTSTKEISSCRLCGVITLPWVIFSVNNFIIVYEPNGENKIDFDITNVCKKIFQVTIVTAKISPNFSLTLLSDAEKKNVNETSIKFLLNPEEIASFRLEFHPKGHGQFVAVAPLYLDNAMSINYSNLTFCGKRLVPKMTPSCSFIIFPVSHVKNPVSRQFYLTLEDKAELQSFSYAMKDNPNIKVKFSKAEILENKNMTLTAVLITAFSDKESSCTEKVVVTFHNQNGALCAIEIYYAFSACALLLHASRKVNSSDNPYPFFPLPEQTQFFNYMDTSIRFLERWMFFQGYRRELFPSIPETFNSVSENMVIALSGPGTKPKGIHVSYLNFLKRIAGTFVKNLKKIRYGTTDEPFKTVSEIYGTYNEIIKLLKSRGVGGAWGLDPKYLLSYRQYKIYTDNTTLENTADIQLLEKLLLSRELFNRLSKQSWMDFILQTYKVFVIENCFFACVRNNNTSKREIIPILLEWYNTAIIASHSGLRNEKTFKKVTNLTTDLKDGVAIVSALLCFCPFLKDIFSPFCEEENDYDEDGVIINNASLIIQALIQLKINFPLSSKDFLHPNYMQMLFLSIHLYITLPMFNHKETIYFNPPLLQRSCRNLTLTNQESVMSHLHILNNPQNSFTVERLTECDSNKKICLTVKYKAYFIRVEKAILLVQVYSRARIFDTFVLFSLHGEVSSLLPYKKCKVFGSMYQQSRVDVLVPSPFPVTANFSLTITDKEPTLPVNFLAQTSGFYVQRLHLIETQITLKAFNIVSSGEVDKIRMNLICMSAQIGNAWIWLRSDIGEFFVKVTTQPRWDLAHETLKIGYEWPAEPCACGENCECYRTTVVRIPHKLEAKQNALRQSFARSATPQVMDTYDRLITTAVGRIVLKMLIAEAGTDMTEVDHILDKNVTYTISSRTLKPRLELVTMTQYSNMVFTLPITLTISDNSGQHSVTLNSECGFDVRNYKIIFIKDVDNDSTNISVG